MALSHMPSLHRRLATGLAVALAVSWAGWFGTEAWQLGRRQTGLWDQGLHAIAGQILTSLPRTLHADNLLSVQAYQLPDPGPPGAGGHDRVTGLVADLAYQVWTSDGRLLLRSAQAPERPLKPDGLVGFGDHAVAGQAWRVVAVSDRTGQVQVQVGKPRARLDAELRRWLIFSLGVTAGLLVSVGAVLWLVLRWTLRPLDAARRALADRAPGDLTPVPATRLPRELQSLVQAFNGLLLRLDAAWASERRFVADAAHELRTPLAALLGQAQLARSQTPPGPVHDTLVALEQGVRRCSRTVEQLLDLARMDAADHLPRQAVRLHEVAALLAHDAAPLLRQRGQHLQLQVEPCTVDASLDALGIVLRNLIDNAARHGRLGGRVRVRVVGPDPGSPGHALLEVADDGPGVPDDQRARVFDRFWRAEGRTSAGSGLGLSLVARIASLHAARLETGPGVDGQGFAVRLWLPVPAGEEGPSAASPGRPSAALRPA